MWDCGTERDNRGSAEQKQMAQYKSGWYRHVQSTSIYGRDKYKYRWQRQVQQQQCCTSSNIWSEIPLEVVRWSGWDEIVLMVRRMATTLAVWSPSCQQKDIWRFPRLWRSSPGLFCVMAYKDHYPHLGTITYGEHGEWGCRQSKSFIMLMLYMDISIYIWHDRNIKSTKAKVDLFTPQCN